MAKVKVKEFAAKLLEEYLEDKDLLLYNTEFVKEGKDWFLRIYIDKSEDENGEMRYISTEDCEMVSRWLSDKLDESDPIEQNYYLEVSSPGLDRTFIKESDYIRFKGKPVEINLYKSINGKKKVNGILKGLENGIVTVTLEKEQQVEIPLEVIAKTKLEVVF